MMKNRLTSLLCPIVVLILLSSSLFAQSEAIDRGQAFLDLSNDAVIMDLSAHPDDEDGATLALYRMKYGVTTYSVLFTRGEGGQNEKGPELYEDLGVIRSEETRRAGAILGTHVVFLDFMDFGFSKSATEAFHIWGGQMEVLRRLVYVIRKYKPDVLFTNHNTIDGHGHHQAVAITAIAAFDAAADSTMFPEQLREPGVSLWQPKKLFFRAFGRMEGTADVSNQINDVDSLRGMGYLDIASQALRQHRTQGMDRANLRAFTRGRSLYKLMRSNSIYEADTTSFLSGIDLWRDPSISSLHALRLQLSSLRAGMPMGDLLDHVLVCEKAIDSLTGCCSASPLAVRLLSHWKDCLERIVTSSCGIALSARLRDSVVVPTQETVCYVSASSSLAKLRVNSWRFVMPPHWTWFPQKENREYTLHIGDDAMPTVPRAIYQYQSLGRDQEIRAVVSCTIDNRVMSLSTPVPFDVAPRQTIKIPAASIAYVPGRTPTPLEIPWEIENWQPRAYNGPLEVVGAPGWKSTPLTLSMSGEYDRKAGTVPLAPPPTIAAGDYPFLVRTTIAQAPFMVHVIDAKVLQGAKVGIIESYDNTLESATKILDVPSTQIDDSTLAHGDLSQYPTIIVDIRAYLVRNVLKSSYQRLLDFVKQGGTLIVMYQRDQEWRPEYAPYPFAISRRRVTHEDAPITVLAPNDPLMTTPNVIGNADWMNWKQERGLYFPTDVPGEYTRLLSCADPDEEQLSTGYLRADYGSGEYVYTSYVWYRQLKEGNPGAFRCFANMLSLHGKGMKP